MHHSLAHPTYSISVLIVFFFAIDTLKQWLKHKIGPVILSQTNFGNSSARGTFRSALSKLSVFLLQITIRIDETEADYNSIFGLEHGTNFREHITSYTDTNNNAEK